MLVLLVLVLAFVQVAAAGRDGRGTSSRAHVQVERDLQPARVLHRLQPRRPSRVARALARAGRERASIVRYARRFLGVQYTWGGTSPSSGFDCSGFTRYVFAHFGISLPHYTFAQFDRGRSVSRRALRPGDLVFFDGIGHVGVYIGADRFIHAPHSGTTVSVARLSGWYSSTFDGARRLVSG